MFKFNVKAWWNPEAAKQRLVQEHWAGVMALAEAVGDQARVNCPYDHSKPADELHLRDTIQVIHEPAVMRSHVIATAPWAEPVEFGYTMRNGRRMPPNPYLRKAVRWGAAAMPRFIGQSRVNQGYHAGRVMGATFE